MKPRAIYKNIEAIIYSYQFERTVGSLASFSSWRQMISMGYQGFPQKQQIQEVVLQTLGGGPESIHVESMVKAPKKRQNFSLNFVAYKVSPCGGHAGHCHLPTRRIFLILLLKQHTPHETYTPTKNEALPLQNDPVSIENSSSFQEMTSGKRIHISKTASNICVLLSFI